MHVDLIYHHYSQEITMEFHLTYEDEESFAFGIGTTSEEANNSITDWFDKKSETHGKTLRVDKTKPYIQLYKKMKDGRKLASGKPINVFESFADIEPVPPESITVTSYDW